MGELVRLCIEIFTLAWPFRQVDQWERAGYYVCGRWWFETGPGLKFVVPWFTNVAPVSLAPAIMGTGRKDITLSDGTVLSYEATATVRVIDVYKALNEVEEYQETAQELLVSVLSERLANVDAGRLDDVKRKRLMSDLTRWVDEEAQQFGLSFANVRFASYVQSVRTYRLLMDQSSVGGW